MEPPPGSWTKLRVSSSPRRGDGPRHFHPPGPRVTLQSGQAGSTLHRGPADGERRVVLPPPSPFPSPSRCAGGPYPPGLRVRRASGRSLRAVVAAPGICCVRQGGAAICRRAPAQPPARGAESEGPARFRCSAASGAPWGPVRLPYHPAPTPGSLQMRCVCRLAASPGSASVAPRRRRRSRSRERWGTGVARGG